MPNSRCGLSWHPARTSSRLPIDAVGRACHKSRIREGHDARTVRTDARLVEYQSAGRVVVEADEVKRGIRQYVSGVVLKHLTGKGAVCRAASAGDCANDVSERGGDGRLENYDDDNAGKLPPEGQ